MRFIFPLTKEKTKTGRNLLAFGALVLLLASCAGKNTPAAACPAAGMLAGADRIPLFADKAEAEGLRVMGEIVNYRGACRYKNPGTAEFQLEIDFGVSKTARADGLKGLKLPYFIAVLGPGDQVLKKERLRVKIDFDNAESVLVTEEHDVQVPFTGADAANYKIVFGFELTREQLDYNRGETLSGKKT